AADTIHSLPRHDALPISSKCFTARNIALWRRVALTDIDLFRNQVFNEDVLDLLGRLPSQSIDCAFADPDYNVGVQYNERSYNRKHQEYIDWCIGWTSETLRAMKEDANLFI